MCVSVCVFLSALSNISFIRFCFHFFGSFGRSFSACLNADAGARIITRNFKKTKKPRRITKMDLHYYVYVCLCVHNMFYAFLCNIMMEFSFLSLPCSPQLLLLHLYNVPQSSITLWIFVFILFWCWIYGNEKRKKENRKIEIQDFSFYALLTYLKGFTSPFGFEFFYIYFLEFSIPVWVFHSAFVAVFFIAANVPFYPAQD